MRNKDHLKGLSKRCMSAVISAILIMSSAVFNMAFPIEAYALEDPNPASGTEEVAIDETLSRNDGTVTANYGTVTINNSIIEDNRGTVTTNNGTVNDNHHEISNSDTGVVQNNYFTATVTGNGTVVNNYAGSVADTIVVTNDFCYVALGESQGILPTYSAGFAVSPDGDQTYEYIQVKKDGSLFNGTGTLVFTPDADHKITGTTGTTFDGNDSGIAFKYTITNNADGSCAVTLSDLQGSIRVDLVTLNLLLSQVASEQIKLEGIESTANLSELIDRLSNSDNDNVLGNRPTFNINPLNNMSSKVNIAMMKRASTGEVKVDLKTQSNLTLDEIRGLIETHSEVSKNIYFDYDGKRYAMHIPAMSLNQDYQNCLAVYANEKDSQAGFMRAAQIFASLGVTISEISPVNPAEQETATVSVGGVVLKSQISGYYAIESFDGFAVMKNETEIKTETGIKGTPYAKAYEITSKKNPSQFAMINAVAENAGATVLGAINVDLGQMNNGKFSDYPETVSVPVSLGVANPEGKKLAIVKVLPGGRWEIIYDIDDNDQTITFPVSGGLASYAVIAYDKTKNNLGGRRGKADGGFNEG